MRFINYILSVLTVVSLIACSDDYTIMEGEQSVPFTFLDSTSSAVTRAKDTSFEEGDIIGIYAVKRNGDAIGTMLSNGNFADNKKYVYRGGGFVPVSESDKIYPPVGQKIDFYAYYPYQDSPNPLDLTMNSSAGQSAGSNYKSSDHLIAKSERAYINSQTPISLPFSHIMGLVEVVVRKNGTDVISSASVAGAAVEQKANLQTGTLRISNSTQRSISMLVYSETSAEYVFRALLPAGNTFSVSKDAFLFTLGSGVTKKFIPSTTLPVQSGKTSRFTLDLPADVITWEYALSVTPTFMAFSSKGEMKNFTVTSTRTKFVNGIVTSVVENVAYSTGISGPDAGGFTVSGNSVIALDNPTTDFRDGTLTITQTDSGKKVTVTLEQEGKLPIDTEI